MKDMKIITILLLCIIVTGAIYIIYDKTVSDKKSALNIIHQRKSVRHFIKDKAVSDKDITTMVNAAMAAPTAGNKQPWEFIVIKDRVTLDKVSECLPYGKFLKNAPLAIVVAGNTDRTFEGIEKEYWVQDTSAATENLLLAAEAIGLGAVWTGVYPVPERVKDVSSVLSLPENIIPLNVIIIGYPEGVEQPLVKTKPEYVHYEKF